MSGIIIFTYNEILLTCDYHIFVNLFLCGYSIIEKFYDNCTKKYLMMFCRYCAWRGWGKIKKCVLDIYAFYV